MKAKEIKKGEKASAETKKSSSPIVPEENICFIISPIGREGTDIYARFMDVYKYVIKPAIDNSGYTIHLVRADEISRTGSFIKDILEHIYNSFIVIADLTDQNPNVFYELGVRHSLSPRTILIAQSVDDIPSDLREYRTIVYDTSARGASEFAKRLKSFLQEIFNDPDRADNPVIDRLAPIIDNRIGNLRQENEELRSQISFFLQRGEEKKPKEKRQDVGKRIERILNLSNAAYQSMLGGSFLKGEERVSLLAKQGNFQLYFIKGKESGIKDFWYVSVHPYDFDPFDDLADARVLMERASQGQNVNCTFIIVTGNDMSVQKDKINSAFEKMKQKLSVANRKLFSLLIWDDAGLTDAEKKLGLKVEP